MAHKIQISRVLNQISKTLESRMDQDTDPGLLTGYCGVALFYAYYYKLTGKRKHLSSLNYVIEKLLTGMSQQDLIFSHCSGISGMLWCIQHLMKNDFLEQDEAGDIFLEADGLLLDYMRQQLDSNGYDFLHEGLGVALYFLDKLPDQTVEGYLSDVAAQLEKAAVSHAGGVSWEDGFTHRNMRGDAVTLYNLGLAHGVPAIISVLSLFYEKGINRNTVKSLITQAVQGLLSAKNEPEPDCVSVFPALVTTDNKAFGSKQSRVAWCYGDLGIAVSLWNTGCCLRDESYKKEAHSLFEHVITHRNKENGKVNDVSLCHGSMGISHILRRMYKNTGDTLFLNGSEYWLDVTLAAAGIGKGLSGFNYFGLDGYQPNYGLLEGISGVGLALIAALDRETTPAWDRCLLLS